MILYRYTVCSLYSTIKIFPYFYWDFKHLQGIFGNLPVFDVINGNYKLLFKIKTGKLKFLLTKIYQKI